MSLPVPATVGKGLDPKAQVAGSPLQRFFKQKVTKVGKGGNQGISPKNANKSKRDGTKCEKEHKEKTGSHDL